MTDRRPDYVRAAGVSCRVLLRLGTVRLPVSLEKVIGESHGIRLKTYGQFCREQGISREEFLSWAVSSHGFTLRRGRRAVILYNEEKELPTIRFTIAHELGHLFLLHREGSRADELEANCFARNLLCPAPAARLLGLEGEEGYARAFRVSLPMARTALACRREDEANLDSRLAVRLEEALERGRTARRPEAVVRFTAREDGWLCRAEDRWLEP